MASRLSLALDTGLLRLPDEGRIAVFGGEVGDTLDALPRDRTDVIQTDFPRHQALLRAGWHALTAPAPSASGPHAAALVIVPRSKDAAHARIAAARALTDGPIIVDGQKTDGVEPLLRALRGRARVSDALSKAHGKLFVVEGGEFADWASRPLEVDGMVTRPGVFSADHVDPGSALLAAALPGALSGRVADLGAGWGWLARAILAVPKVTEVHLVEADAVALDCARESLADPRARFHWDDVTTFRPHTPFDAVVTNPPFHDGRKGAPDIGRAFIRAAAGMLQRHGTLWLVANRHLPYEATLAEAFAEVQDVGGDARYKLFRAARPRTARRG
ncbi:class I SAM-dependent methyltransferase [Palleronia sp. KMU-117]|uniref:class I SAM-dependent methyltransferase n=1 Tax=Palleronia sp. KMU-117 TaxID=3434108 RepID=UPI003D764997